MKVSVNTWKLGARVLPVLSRPKYGEESKMPVPVFSGRLAMFMWRDRKKSHSVAEPRNHRLWSSHDHHILKFAFHLYNQPPGHRYPYSSSMHFFSQAFSYEWASSSNIDWMTWMSVTRHPWSHVVIGMWHKYPNPKCSHVVSIDVVDRSVDPKTGIIRTERILGCKQKAPSWIVKVQ